VNGQNIVAVVISNDSSKQRAMAEVFAALPSYKIAVHDADFRSGIEKVEATSADVVVVFLDDHPEVGCSLLAKLKQARSEVFVFAISADRSADLIVKAIRAGADELLSAVPSVEELLPPVVKIVEARRREQQGPGGEGKIITAYSPHGGAGVTTFVTNLATSIHRVSDAGVCLVDLDFQNGDTPVYLNFKHPYSILDVCEHVGNLDPVFLQGTLFHHDTGIEVLSPPPMLEDGESIATADVMEVLKILTKDFEYVIVDTSSFLNDMTFSVVETADRVFLLTDNMVSSVRAMQRVANTMDRLDVSTEKLSLVLNRPVEQSKISRQDIAEVVNLEVDRTLPSDPLTAIEAANRGVPLYEINPKSPLVRALTDIARSLTGATEDYSNRGKIFGRFFSGDERA